MVALTREYGGNGDSPATASNHGVSDMNRNDPIQLDPIRIEDFARCSAPGAFTPGQVTRLEAGRQFRFSLALVLTLTVATVAAAVTMPMGAGSAKAPQIAHNAGAGDLTYTVIR